METCSVVVVVEADSSGGSQPPGEDLNSKLL